MPKDWNDLQYSNTIQQENTLVIESAGAKYDASSGTIQWHAGDTFILKFKPEEAIKETTPNNSIYDEPILDACDYFDGYKFAFSVYSIYGAKDEPVFEVVGIEMDIAGMIPITIGVNETAEMKPGIYNYSLIAYTEDIVTKDITDAKTIVGRKQGKIQVLS